MSSVRRLRGLAIAFVALSWSLPVPGQTQEADEGEIVNQSDHPLLRPFRWRSIGPIGQGGRVDDIAVSPEDVHTFFVGFATAGLWKTTNNGTTFRPVFDTHTTASVGDIAIAPSDPDIVWVGTGESNNRQSSSLGAGVYKSTDGGETFTHVGLTETQSISRVPVHPSDPDVVWVAAGILIAAPVCGLRPWRAARLATLKLPKPVSRTSSPLTRLSVMVVKTASTARWASALLVPVMFATASTSSLLVAMWSSWEINLCTAGRWAGQAQV